MVKPRWALLALSFGMALGPGRPALADVIDGNWCAKDGRTMSISGPRIVTPAGTTTSGDWHRHSFTYDVPTGEADAGSRVDMLLLDENTVRLTKGGAPEIWHRCDVNS